MKIANYFKVVSLFFMTIVIQAQTPTSTVVTKGDVNNPYIVTGSESITATQSITLKPDTWIKQGSVFTAKIIPDAYILPNFSNENYVFTRKFQTAMSGVDGILYNKDVVESIEYFDGLGKPMQHIDIKASPSKYDIVTHMENDDFGRQEKEYLSYPETAGATASYRTDAKIRTNNYYISNYSGDINSAVPNPFSQKLFESSPLNRVLQEGAPGKDWALGSGHEIKTDYSTNIDTDKIKFYTVSAVWNEPLKIYDISLGNSSGTSFYPAGQLYKTIVKDENWVPAAGSYYTTEEFKDRQGKLILKKTYGTSVVNGNNEGVIHETYFVYDLYGNLTYVIPPKADGVINSTILDNLCYQYKYDDRNRLVEKKLPGKDWEYIVYDKLDRVALTQDANLKTLNKWNFIKYDDFNRPVYTGEYLNSVTTNRAGIQGLADNQSVMSENRQSTVLNINGTNINYSNNAFPNTEIDLFTISYYDNYLNIDLDGGISSVSYGKTPITDAKGLTICAKTRVLGTTNWTTLVNYYDDKGRIIYNYSKNNYLNAVNTSKTQFDFGGKVLEAINTLKKGSDSVVTLVDAYSYDHAGHLLDHKQTINNQPQEVIVSNKYNDLGQLVTKNVGGSITKSRLQNVDYSYNIRGWLKSINNVNAIGNDLFAFSINYNDIADRSTPLYNGNISKASWRTANIDNSIRDYIYIYDELNRLAYAIGDQDDQQEIPTYDKNGNIVSMYRTDDRPKATSTSKKVMQNIDNLIYTYDGGNKLLKVEDSTGNPDGFFNGANITTEYTYDANGNMKTDVNKGITAIDYNNLNLPIKITKGSGIIEYVYDAAGVKQRKIVSGITTDYAGGFQYENDVLQFFSQPEGYVYKNNGVFEYIYQYKDHLGNVRLSFNKDLTIVEENNYYPFGLKQLGYNNVVNSIGNSRAQKYKYNGKEFQDELGLNLYDYGARNYDATIGRWMNIDPMAEERNWLSPYNYVQNNPVFKIDPDGMLDDDPSTDVIKEKNGTYTVVGGDITDGDNSIYEVNGDGSKTRIGYSATPYSFYNTDENAFMGRIDPNNNSGRIFLNGLLKNNPSEAYYGYKATGGKKFDFKRTNGTDKAIYSDKKVSDYFRGMPILGKENGFSIYASARDVGNIGAGLVIGRSGDSWSFARTGFDALESYQKKDFARETAGTVYAERLGWNIGNAIFQRETLARIPGNAHLYNTAIPQSFIRLNFTQKK